jgi:hypothetical protein
MKLHSIKPYLRIQALALLTTLPLAAQVIPVDLPPQDSKPPSKDKPVKVYILSGQSNMVGFGATKPAAPQYGKIFFSADPTAKAALLPVGGNVALLPHGIHDAKAAVYGGAYDSKADYTKLKPAKEEAVQLGNTNASLPSIYGAHTVVVNASFDVPYDGNYLVHPGFESSTHAVVEVYGKEVYRKGEEGQVTSSKVSLKKNQRYPIRITYLKGGSAAFLLEQVDLRAYGDLPAVINDFGRFRYLRADDGSWVKRTDVVLNDAYLGKGASAPHGVEACGPTFGPELGFGFVMGTFHDEPVIVIKADIGNRSLGWDILPPGSGRVEFEGKTNPGYGETMDPDGTIRKPKEGEWYAGKQYDDYTASLRAVLDKFGEKYPEYKDQGYEVAGFLWWQGHKDGGSEAHIAHYEQNLANLIRAWRKEFNAPNAPWAIATVGFQGENMPENYVRIAQAQLNVADPKRHPEFAGNVKTIDARPFWREVNVSPKNQDYHYNHNAETYMLCGDALGRAIVEMKGGKVEYPNPKMLKELDTPPHLKALTTEEYQEMIPAIKPLVLEKLIPLMLNPDSTVAFHQRRGLQFENILGGKKPAKVSENMETQLDSVIDHYELVGIKDYSWKPFGPEMQKAEWNYLTFDPAEKKTEPEGDRYRKVTLPTGSENWFVLNFDSTKAGWKKAKAPFGQKNGKLEALIESCTVPYCGCNITPATLWDKEVILMQQTFEVPKLDADHLYRIVVGGGGHAWSGEGFALYLNGKLVSEVKAGYYKSGGQARGVILLDDLLPEFENGKVTIAIQAFLRQNGHRNKAADPSGHMSVWMESAKLSEPTLELAKKMKTAK